MVPLIFVKKADNDKDEDWETPDDVEHDVPG
jgi:hypothetical protein